MVVEVGLKQTEIGIIPKDWEILKLAEIGTVIRGASPRPKGDKRYYGGNIPRLMVEDVTRDGKIVFPQIDFLTVEGAERSRPCKKGTLTIVCSGTVGITSFLGVDACIHDGFLALINLNTKINDDYLYHQLSGLQQRFNSSATHGGVFTNLTTSGVNEFFVPFPPSYEEQHAIAEALSDMDALITAQEALIVKKRAIKQGVMQELLTGKRRLPGFNGEWEEKTLGEVVDITKGQLITEKNAIKGQIPVVAGGKQPSYYHNSANRHGETITISASGANAGFIAFYQTPIFASDCSTISHSNNYEIRFIYQYLLLKQEFIFRLQSGGAQPHIHPSDLIPIIIHIPEIIEQQAIATILFDLDEEINTLEQIKDKNKALKQGMMQELLTGRIRLM